MIEVKASLIGRNVYIAGEQLHCIITLTNVTQLDSSKSTNSSSSNSNKDEIGVERLAWASAQIHCQCVINEARINLPQEFKNNQRNPDQTVDIGTYFAPNRGDAGHSAYLSKPQVLCCDLVLGPGCSKTFHYVETLPYNCPPSYRGNNVKYAYKLSIGFQKLHSTTKLLRIPMRVININGIDDMQQYMELAEPAEVSTNPFLSHIKKECSFLDNALEVLSIQASRRNLGCYSITNKSGLVGNFNLYKLAYRLGEDVVGYFDFSDAQITCLQYTVVLQSLEEVRKDCLKHNSQNRSINASYSRFSEACISTVNTHFILPIPLTITPGFDSNLVTLRWRLRFEFIISTQDLANTDYNSRKHLPDEAWQGPNEVETESLLWDLPIEILATNPVQAFPAVPARLAANLLL